MIEDRPSRTAVFVATMRALGAVLPDGAQLADDPFGARVAPAAWARIAALARARPALRPLLRATLVGAMPSVVYLQMRTRLIDDVVRRFVEAGGAQLVILGAGFDARAARLRPLLDGVRVFEIDHPATQARKRACFGETGAVYLAWDFERDDMAALGARLASVGHQPARPTLTIWEGVTMYLTEPAIEATLAAVRGWSAPGSQLAFTYFDRHLLEHPSLRARAVAMAVRLGGEPWRFGWPPAALPGWLAAHGLRLVFDVEVAEAATHLLPPRYARLVRRRGRHLAVAAPLV